MRFIKGLLLIIVILLCGAFIYAKVGSLGGPDNYFNSHYRLKLDRYPMMRGILGLHSYGDARGDFLGTRYPKISIEVDVLDGVDADTNVLSRFAAKVQDITGKPTSYFISDTNLPYSDPTADDVAKIIRRYKNRGLAGSAGLYVLIADTSKDNVKQLGSTYQESGIVLYGQSVKDFTASSDGIYEDYAFSTLLHEFGHQLGLDHNDGQGCLMNPKAETNDQPRFFADDVVTDFCQAEKDQIAPQKALAQ